MNTAKSFTPVLDGRKCKVCSPRQRVGNYYARLKTICPGEGMPKVHRVLLKARRAFIMEKKPTP